MHHNPLIGFRLTPLICMLVLVWLITGCRAPAAVADAQGSRLATVQPTTATGTPAPTQVAASTAPASGETLANMPTHEGVPVGFTAEGYPFRGDPNAPLTLIEYSDYLCPFCGRHFDQTAPLLLEKYGKSGQVRFVFRDFPIPGLHPTATVGHAAARCVAEQGATHFWAMHDALFGTQQQWGQLRDPSEFVAGLAEDVGVDMDAYTLCMANGQAHAQVADSAAEARGLGFNGTPSFQLVVNESNEVRQIVGALPVDQFVDLIDEKLNDDIGAGQQSDIATSASASQVASTGSDKTESGTDDAVADAAPEEPVATGAAGPTIASDLRLADLDSYQGTPVGFTEEGYPFRGDPNAPITFIEWSDYLCPFCGRHYNQTATPLIDKYALNGDVLFVFRDLPLVVLHPTAPVGHVAARCVGEQGAPRFWAMYDELFRTQQQWANLPDPTEFVAALAADIGADMETYADCIDAGQAAREVDESVAEASALGFNGTPSFQFVVNETGAIHELMGAYPLDEFSRWLDALMLNGEPPEGAQVEEAEPAELPFWANAEGLAPDPDRPGYTLAGDQYKGNPEAPLVVVEFVDFQCPPCREHALTVQPAVDEAFIASDEILWVFKHLPLKEHAQAPLAAVAAECAAAQGKFWEMHDLIFAGQEEWSNAEAETLLPALAEALELDMAAFAACFNGRHAFQDVLNDLYDAQGLIQTTPTFVFLADSRGSLVEGSRAVDQFVTTVQVRLDTAKSSQEGGE